MHNVCIKVPFRLEMLDAEIAVFNFTKQVKPRPTRLFLRRNLSRTFWSAVPDEFCVKIGYCSISQPVSHLCTDQDPVDSFLAQFVSTVFTLQ